MAINFLINAAILTEMNNYVEITVGTNKTKLFGGTPSIQRTGTATGEAIAVVKVRGNTAVRGEDFVIRSQDTIRWRDGESGSKGLSQMILALSDNKEEPPEKLTFYIESVTDNETIDEPKSMEIFIIDEPKVTVVAENIKNLQ